VGLAKRNPPDNWGDFWWVLPTLHYFKIFLIPSPYGSLTIPFSVMMAVMYRFGVTSKAGLLTLIPSGAMRTPRISVTSAAARSSIGIASPEANDKSKVVVVIFFRQHG
jgi:hypothetical protein